MAASNVVDDSMRKYVWRGKMHRSRYLLSIISSYLDLSIFLYNFNVLTIRHKVRSKAIKIRELLNQGWRQVEWEGQQKQQIGMVTTTKVVICSWACSPNVGTRKAIVHVFRFLPVQNRSPSTIQSPIFPISLIPLLLNDWFLSDPIFLCYLICVVRNERTKCPSLIDLYHCITPLLAGSTPFIFAPWITHTQTLL